MGQRFQVNRNDWLGTSVLDERCRVALQHPAERCQRKPSCHALAHELRYRHGIAVACRGSRRCLGFLGARRRFMAGVGPVRWGRLAAFL